MESEKWFKDRKIGETAMRALWKVTPDALKTLQDKELEALIDRLAEVMGICGLEKADRPVKKKRRK